MITTVLFDLDGVILDSERPTQELWKKELPTHKFYPLWKECLGLTTTDEFKVFQRSLGWTQKQYQDFQHKTSLSQPPKFQSGVLDLIKWLYEEGYTIAIVTSSSMESVRRKLDISDGCSPLYLEWIKRIITGDDVASGKPSPEIYLKSMELLQVHPNQCIVIEDSLNGIQSAQSAGIQNIIMVEDTIRCPNNYTFSNVMVTHTPLYKLKNTIQRMKGYEIHE